MCVGGGGVGVGVLVCARLCVHACAYEHELSHGDTLFLLHRRSRTHPNTTAFRTHIRWNATYNLRGVGTTSDKNQESIMGADVDKVGPQRAGAANDARPHAAEPQWDAPTEGASNR